MDVICLLLMSYSFFLRSVTEIFGRVIFGGCGAHGRIDTVYVRTYIV